MAMKSGMERLRDEADVAALLVRPDKVGMQPSPALPRTPPPQAGEGLGERGQVLFKPDQYDVYVNWDWNEAMSVLDFYHVVPDDRLIAYSRVPLLDRLKWLDEICRFTLAVRAAPGRMAQNPSIENMQMKQPLDRDK
jgi:hypothetical protein